MESGLRLSNFYVGCVSQNIFCVGQHFTWVIILTWVIWVKNIIVSVSFFFGSKYFAWVNYFFARDHFLTIFLPINSFMSHERVKI